MNKNSLILIFAAITLSGCATKTIVDNTPRNPTAVLKSSTIMNGAIIPDGRTEQTVYTRLDQRRMQSKTKFDSFVSRSFLGEGEADTIERVDKNLSWMLSPKKKTYVECPLAGCNTDFRAKLGQIMHDDEMKADEQSDESQPAACETELADLVFDVKQTGETRDVRGFSAQQYIVTWRAEIKDKQDRVSKNELTMDLWTTTPSAEMNEVFAMLDQYDSARNEAIAGDQSPLANFVPSQVYLTLIPYLGMLSDNDMIKRVSDEFSKIKGYTVSSKLEISASGNACKEPEDTQQAREDSTDFSDPMGAAKKLAGSFFKKQAEKKVMPSENEPVARIVYEITSMQIESIHDSMFNVPSDYKLISRE